MLRNLGLILKKQLLFLIVIDNLYICIKSMHY